MVVRAAVPEPVGFSARADGRFPELQDLQKRLGHVFAEPQLLRQALIHRSYGQGHNERLEFLGDAVLNLAVSKLLFDRLSASDEGDLTRVRAHLVREASLHQTALALNLGALIRMSEGEAKGGGAHRPSILADAMEAVLGAVYLDAGMDAAQALVARLLGERMAQGSAEAWRKDPKTELQEQLQGRRLPVPAYRIVATRGQPHAQTFEVVCEVPSLNLNTHGEGNSRRNAEQQAARKMLALLPQHLAPQGAPVSTQNTPP
jgi:ribonuclease-3